MSAHKTKSSEASQWILDEKLIVLNPVKIDRSKSYPSEDIPKRIERRESLLDNVHRHFRMTLKAVSESSSSLTR